MRFLSFCFVCSDAEGLASPPRELAVSPHRVASPLAMDTPPQPEAPSTGAVASPEKAMVTPDVAATSSRPATWEEHVSYPFSLFT